jgi:PAS domain S-box-containing protein
MKLAQSVTRSYLFVLIFLFLTLLGQSGYAQNSSIDSLRTVLKSASGREFRFAILKQLAFEYRQSKPDSSLYFGLTAIELGNQLRFDKQLAEAYNFVGLAHSYKGELARAFDNYQSALRLAEVSRDDVQIGHSYNNLGRLFLQIGDAPQAMLYFLIAKKSFESVNDLPGLSYVYRSFSEWQESKKDYDSAIFFSSKALNLRRQLPGKNSLVSAIMDVGQLYQQKKEYSKATTFLKEAESLASKNRDPFLLAEIKIRTIELLMANNELLHLEEIISEVDRLVDTNQTELRAKVNLLKGQIALRRKKNNSAILFLKLIVDDANVTDHEIKSTAASLLVEAFYSQGDFKEAEKYRLRLKMEQGNKRNQGLLNELEKINLKFELERRGKLNQEIELANVRKRTALLVIGSIVSFGSIAMGIAFMYAKRRTKDRKAHEAQESILLRKLTDSEKENKKLLEESLLVICTHDLDGKLLSINSPGARAIGYEPKELIGKAIESIIPQESTKAYKNYIDEIRATGTSSGFIRLVTRWKEVRTFLYRNVLIDDGGKPVYVMASALDVTGWKKIEQEERRLRVKLAESEKLYRLLSENSSDLVCLHDPAGNYLFVSSSVTELLGYTVDEMVGTHPQAIVHSDDQYGLQREVTMNNASAYRMKKKDGSYIWMETYTQPVEESGKQVGYQTSSRDITMRKEYEQALREAKEKAEEATKYKSDFVSSMSHEIRTPLNAIIGLADILLKRNPREDQVKIFQMLKNSGDNLLTIVNDILDFSKIEAGKMELEESVFNLSESVLEIVQLFNERAKSKNVALLFQPDPKLPTWIKADQVKIIQVISNLVSNAIKFTAEGKVEVVLQLVERKEGQVTILVAVTDTGIGISADKLDVIFESFAQAGQDTARIYGGTGLGLAIVKKLTMIMGSEIFVESAPAKGSRFFFTLKVKEIIMP